MIPSYMRKIQRKKVINEPLNKVNTGFKARIFKAMGNSQEVNEAKFLMNNEAIDAAKRHQFIFKYRH